MPIATQWTVSDKITDEENAASHTKRAATTLDWNHHSGL
jgi:hypothetical protein